MDTDASDTARSEDIPAGEEISEFKLQVSESNFYNLVEAGCFALVVHRDFHLLYVNAEALKMFEIPSLDSLLGQSIFDYIHPRFQRFAKLSIQRVIRRNESISPIQIKAVTASGRELDIDLRSIPVQFNESSAVMSILYDISERKQAENELQQKKAQYKSLYSMLRLMCDNMPDMIWARDLDSRYIFANKALCDNLLHAKDTDEPLGKTDMFFAERERAMHPDDPEWHTFGEICRDSDAITQESGKAQQFDEFGNIRGKFLYLDVRKAPMLDVHGDVIGVVGSARDVTGIKQAEVRFRTLSAAIEQAGEAVCITDINGLIEYVNPAFSKITGYSADEIIGRKPSVLKSDAQDAAFYQDLWATIRRGEVWHGSLIDKKKDGAFYPAMMSIAPICDEQGKNTHYVAIQQDMTNEKRLEEQFHQAQKMEAIGTLVGGIAHDFNNMLAGMTGNAYLIKQRTREMPEVTRKLSNIEQLSLRAADMIQQLLTFARKSMVNMKTIPLTPFFKETLKLLRSSIPENIKMHQDICSENLEITGDTTQLNQVLMNLVSNARDAVEGVDDPCISIKLAIWQADKAFIDHHPYVNNKPYAHMSVQDNGCGIPDSQIEHLFEPFFTTKEQGKGTGLGLAMVFGAVKTHHGFVEVDSSEGCGSGFHVYIPLLQSEEISALGQEKNIVSGHGEMILLVDDEQHVVETGKEVLEVLGYRVLTAANGLQAVEIFEAQPEIELCIFDVVMPLLGGNEAAKSIRRINPEAKIIFFTSYDRNLLTGMAHETVLCKPFAIDEMSRLIRKKLDS